MSTHVGRKQELLSVCGRAGRTRLVRARRDRREENNFDVCNVFHNPGGVIMHYWYYRQSFLRGRCKLQRRPPRRRVYQRL
eukprot:9164443-Lingulodinium_polyedra.AAC.1